MLFRPVNLQIHIWTLGMKRKRKPDLLAVLAIVVGLGVIASGLAQGMLTISDTQFSQLGPEGKPHPIVVIR